MSGLKAAHLNQKVVVTGGRDWYGNYRDEVLGRILQLVMRCLACLQVLQYNPSNKTWTKIGSMMKNGRAYHAVAEVNLVDLACVGNLNPVKKIPQSWTVMR